ncbi:hypothetical protein HPB49_007017 [Dermacentor silvarum]|uniref:Uncharacterized protein n=1 Tax=Dermacentor silvarum TaxID=543639 RepID=A0ACB8CJT2_DERSI|nr:hypothetical protein HPB49_007017 [Dermacentor silvarum]
MASEELTVQSGSRKPAPRFTPEEKSLLLSLVNNHKKVLECKKTDVASLSAKSAAWKKLAVEYNAQHGVTPRDFKQLKKCWGNMKQKWKEENSEEKRKIHKTGGGPAAAGMTPLSALVGAVAGHMATRIANENDSDGATYLPPVDSQPVVRLLQPMVTEVEAVYDYYEEHRSPGHMQNDEAMDYNYGVTHNTCAPNADENAAALEHLDNDSNKENELDRPAREASPRPAQSHPEASPRPPRGRMALLERTLSCENDVRIALLREEHKTRMRLLEEEHKDNLQKRNEEHKIKMEILQVQKQVELAKLTAMNERV